MCCFLLLFQAVFCCLVSGFTASSWFWLLQAGVEVAQEQKQHNEEVASFFLPLSLLGTRVRTRVKPGRASSTMSKQNFSMPWHKEGAQKQPKSPFPQKHRVIRKPSSVYDVLLNKAVKTGKTAFLPNKRFLIGTEFRTRNLA